VSDNASDDDTPEVVRSFADDRIEYVRSERNIGAVGNFNRLIALAETDFLVLLPDDDLLGPGYLAAVVEVLNRYPNVGLVHSAFDIIDAQSRVIRRAKPTRSRASVRIESRDLALERLMARRWGICFSSVAYRTGAVREAGGLREAEEPFGDGQLWMRVALDWDFAYIPRPLVGFRDHPSRLSTDFEAQLSTRSSGRGHAPPDAQIHFDRRISFLSDAPLEPRRANWLNALATLQLLVDTAAFGLSPGEVASRLASLVRKCPRIVFRPALWHLVGAQLGGRRLRSVLRESSTRRRGLEHV
jgi:glycosyltransferase involved in cell wall biosynthesis